MGRSGSGSDKRSLGVCAPHDWVRVVGATKRSWPNRAGNIAALSPLAVIARLSRVWNSSACRRRASSRRGSARSRSSRSRSAASGSTRDKSRASRQQWAVGRLKVGRAAHNGEKRAADLSRHLARIGAGCDGRSGGQKGVSCPPIGGEPPAKTRVLRGHQVGGAGRRRLDHRLQPSPGGGEPA